MAECVAGYGRAGFDRVYSRVGQGVGMAGYNRMYGRVQVLQGVRWLYDRAETAQNFASTKPSAPPV